MIAEKVRQFAVVLERLSRCPRRLECPFCRERRKVLIDEFARLIIIESRQSETDKDGKWTKVGRE